MKAADRGPGSAGPPRAGASRRDPLPAPGRRSGLRLLRRIPRQGRVPARLADRCLDHRPGAAPRQDARDGADVGDADGRRRVRLHSRPTGDRGTPAEIRLPSEFDFARQAVLYLPPRMPDPRSPDFSLAAGRQVIEILKRTRGRAFVLFTSYATLREVQAIAEMALDYPILVQGTAPRTQLAQAVPRNAARGPVRHVELLAGRGRRRRSAELRHRGQAAVRVAGRPDHERPHRRHPGARRRAVRRVSGAAGHPGAAAGARPPHPPSAATAECWRSSTRGCGRRATAAVSWRRFPRRRSCTSSTQSTGSFHRSCKILST